MKVREKFILLSIILLILVIVTALFWQAILWSFIIIVPLILMGVYDVFQTKHTIRRNFPIIGRFRYTLEEIRPEIMQYFVETDTEGRPLNRIFSSLIYQRAKKEAPEIVASMMADIQDNIQDVFDIKSMVMDAFTRDRSMLVRFFQDIGYKEFAFVQNSGLWFGFLFGCIQMLIWMA